MTSDSSSSLFPFIHFILGRAHGAAYGIWISPTGIEFFRPPCIASSQSLNHWTSKVLGPTFLLKVESHSVLPLVVYSSVDGHLD